MDKIENKKNKVLIFLFVIYCLLLVWIILLKLSFSIIDLPYLRKVIFKPFPYGIQRGFPLKELLVNILLFIPFGVYLKMLGINNKKTVLIGFMVSLVFEVLQYILAIGVTDTTDIITNTLGTTIGVFSYLLACKIFKNKEKIDKVLQILAIIATIIVVIILPFCKY